MKNEQEHDYHDRHCYPRCGIPLLSKANGFGTRRSIRMNWKEVVAGMVMLILIYLLVNNASGTSKVIESGSGGLTETIKALQGR